MIVTRRVLTVLAWTNIIAACILTLVLNLGPVEFSSDAVESTFLAWRVLGVTASILLLILLRIRDTDAGLERALKLIAAVVFSVIFLVLAGIVGFASGMCSWSESSTVFINEADPGRRIVIRDFGCGATDGGPPVIKTFEMKRLTNWLNYVHQVDTTLIDRAQWRRVESEQ
ncbi:MAG: hypothetical protein KA791_06000 [Flavobacteriales bacterium]|nr:hypothetical protein [Flavobacteriales bacterium]